MPAAPCSAELSNLVPTITSCPADTDLLLFVNVAGQTGGYAFRPWSVVKNCLSASILGALRYAFAQFLIGSSSPVNPGDNSIIITQSNIIQDSVQVILGGQVLPRNDPSQISYGLVYTANDVTINFSQPLMADQLYIITYAYSV